MFLKGSNVTFMFIMFFSTIMVISSSSWLNAWISLEVNMMSIIPILINKQTFEATSSSIKYFLVQAMASMFLIVMMLIMYNSSAINMMNINNEIILMGLAMKSGIPPFHFWLPQVIESMEVTQMFIVLSWQKIAPFSLMSYSLSMVILAVISSSAAVGAVGGYNQNSIKKILVYSSMTHGAWMMTAMLMKSGLWMIYFAIYNLSLYIMCLIMDKMNIKNISETSNSFMPIKNKMILMSNMLSMSGLPPFLGFAAKFLVIKMSVIYSMLVMVSILLMMSFLSVFYYLKICFSSFMLNEKQIFKMSKKSNSSMLLYMITISNMIIPTMVYLV
uniref:NADH-ubiquinone oxidoreductase chain 2 n=1 Tax=Bourletiella arvalis TaxID=2049373 RepID=A0A384XAS6_9HEXA|nr:NADH dehydrogenase subunit 2 [Bourletiella arvalis]ATP01399.1 NADH dehydrogenase subunit 2 [Bourletiella arvalis]